MYKIEPSLCLSHSRKSTYQLPLINNPKKLYEIFTSMESASEHACRTYQASYASRGDDSRQITVHSKDIKNLLTDLLSTVRNLPPFVFGKSSLV